MYHYKESGLDHVWLVNGYKVRRTAYGRAIAIEDVAGLHASIADHLTDRAGPLTREAFRFLRKELGLSQKDLGTLIGADAQAIARWERGVSKIDPIAGRLLCALYRERRDGKVRLWKMCEHLAGHDEAAPRSIRLKRHRADWKVAA